MKAPDKIYIGTAPSKVGDGVVYTTVLEEYPNAKEYICKDLLLEWAEQQEKQALEELVNGLPLNGKLAAFRRVVEKIESM